jgi:hypothetical protein
MSKFWTGRLRAARLLVVMAMGAALFTALTPVAANAATVRTWDRLARCESSGRWHINTGNGYYGGLQISRPTWRGYGGRRFARLPSRATKDEQIRVATRILHHQGWRAWPVCSRRIGVG